MKVLIVEDHELFRNGIQSIVKKVAKNANVRMADSIAMATSQLSGEEVFELALVDVGLPDGNGAKFVETWITKSPQTLFVMLSAEENAEQIRSVLAAGAKGYLTKNLPTGVIEQALHLILAGGTYIPQQALTDGSVSNELDSAAIQITPRQLEVLGELAKGLSNKEIARELGMSPGTVKVHVAALISALEVSNRTQVVGRAQELALIDSKNL